MLIFFLISLLPLLVAPMSTHRIFLEAEAFELRHVAVDNAAILLGQGARRTFREIEKAQRILQTLDLAHHAFHLCARVPETAAGCLLEDRMIEAEIQSFSALMKGAAQASWALSYSS